MKLIDLAEGELSDQEREHREWLHKRVAGKQPGDTLRGRMARVRSRLGAETDEELLNLAKGRLAKMQRPGPI